MSLQLVNHINVSLNPNNPVILCEYCYNLSNFILSFQYTKMYVYLMLCNKI